MSQKSRERQIKLEGCPLAFSFNVMPAKQGIMVSSELIKMIAPIFGAILDDETNKDISFEESSLFSQIATHLVYSVDSNKIVAMIDLLLQDLYKGSQKVNWDEEFAADYHTLVLLVEFALKENFGDFFTKYFKAKGLEIPTWASLKTKVDTALKSREELKENPQ